MLLSLRMKDLLKLRLKVLSWTNAKEIYNFNKFKRDKFLRKEFMEIIRYIMKTMKQN